MIVREKVKITRYEKHELTHVQELCLRIKIAQGDKGYQANLRIIDDSTLLTKVEQDAIKHIERITKLEL